MRAVWIVGSLVLTAAAAAAGTPATAGCEEWMASFADYDAAAEKTLDGEPISYLRAISNAIELRRGQDLAAVAALREKLAERAREFRALAPPPELAAQHRLMSDFLDSVIGAVAAVEQRDLPWDDDDMPDEELIFRLPTRRCYETLLAYYRELLGLLERHRCNEGDIEALRERYIPRFEEVLAHQFTGERGL